MRPRRAWIVFTLAFAVVLAVMAWGTAALLDLERERAQTEQRALLEEQVRLALWRMDTAMTPLVSMEMAATGPLGPAPEGSLPQGVRARFSIDAMSEVVVHGALETSARDELRERLANTRDLSQTAALGAIDGLFEGETQDDAYVASKIPLAQQSQAVRNVNELSKRAGKVADNLEVYQSTIDRSRNQAGEGRFDGERPEAGPMRALWIRDALVLVRTVHGAGTRLQGSVLDWEVVRSMLHAEMDDLLPNAHLEPASSDDEPDGRRLATLPVRLVPGELDAAPLPEWSPLRATVMTGWAFLLLAGLAVALLLRASLTLSERRAAFVSAVTHELRTPLTTFRMYTEMLQEGMVETKRERYLATLRREAERLGNLVENVLAFARIESDRTPRALETLPVATLVDRMRERLEQRCSAARLELRIEVPAEVADTSVRIDPAAIEQVIFNLVDNAAKYAPSEDHPSVHLRACRLDGVVALHVRDFGPGIVPGERRRIFEPFAKGSMHAAGTKPGVGLGLALSRRLAREQGGDLEVRDAAPGADFVLTLPIA